MDKLPITENSSQYDHIENMSTAELLMNINQEDSKVAPLVREIIPKIEAFVEEASQRLQAGGRLFYLGAGTSGRLGVVDASECPPTFGVSYDLVIGLIAGGDAAIRKAVEFAEDDPAQAWKDMEKYFPDQQDVVVGIAASGTTPYVIGGVKESRAQGLLTGSITCNPGSPLGKAGQFPMEVSLGPEFITGSTRMKSGTAQKLILNMISTSLMVKLGRVKGNRMVDMQLSNRKLQKRGIRMLREALNIEETEAEELLKQYGSVRKAIDQFNSGDLK
jgi:N-acetylmuramic acid 6-phosphate etherase